MNKQIRIAMIARSTLFSVPGGDTVQIVETARHLSAYSICADIRLSNEDIDYNAYDLLHFFNITRPADMLKHIRRSDKPYVVSPIYVDYSEYDKNHRGGLSRRLFSWMNNDRIEYTKTIARWLKGNDVLAGADYLWKGHRRSISDILRNATLVLPNSVSEMERMQKSYGHYDRYFVVTNGVDDSLFCSADGYERDGLLVLCAARIEGIKNQLNLIRALNDTEYQLLLVGAAAPNQQAYYRQCRKIAAGNIHFTGRLSQQEIRQHYQRAKLHVLPSWFETTGLSSLEAAAMGCQVVISDRGDAKEYFGKAAFYCDPASPASIKQAIDDAAKAKDNTRLQARIHACFTWQQATCQTREAYRRVLAL